MVVEAFVTSPMADITLTVAQPLGYTVNFSFPIVKAHFSLTIFFRTCFILVKLHTKQETDFLALIQLFGMELELTL